MISVIYVVLATVESLNPPIMPAPSAPVVGFFLGQDLLFQRQAPASTLNQPITHVPLAPVAGFLEDSLNHIGPRASAPASTLNQPITPAPTPQFLEFWPRASASASNRATSMVSAIPVVCASVELLN